jgi:hypothetical protein
MQYFLRHSLLINVKSKKIYFAVLLEIYNNVVPYGSAVLINLTIILLHALSILQKTLQIRDLFFLYMDPEGVDCALLAPGWRRTGRKTIPESTGVWPATASAQPSPRGQS